MKSVYRGPDGLAYRTPPRSQNEPDCVAIADLPNGGVRLRNSNKPDGGHVDYTASEWAAFIASIVDGWR